MRKIIYILDTEVVGGKVEDTLIIKMMDDSGDVSILKRYLVSNSDDDFTPIEKLKIYECNEALCDINQPKLTKEEINFMLDPTGMKRKSQLKIEEMQGLAGVAVAPLND
jgi:hypothetical protein